VAEVAGNEDEKYTVKLYKPSGADIRLEADNIDDKYPPIVRKASSGEIRVKGIVVAFLKPI
jgi:SOS-response transcriptional repressor LexA